MKNLSNYSVLLNENDDVYYIVLKKDIKRHGYLHDTYATSIRATSSQSFDYSLYNREGDAIDDMTKAGVELFGESFRGIQYYDDYETEFINKLECKFEPNNLEELGLGDKEEEIKAFLCKWEKDHAQYTKVDYITFWDGKHFMSVVVNDCHIQNSAQYIELSEEEAEPILKGWLDIKEWNERYVDKKEMRNAGYIYIEEQNKRFEQAIVLHESTINDSQAS